MAGRGTPAITVAADAGVGHRVHEYAHDPTTPSYGLEAATALGLDPGRVFKTLVVSVDGALTVCMIPVDAQLDLRALGKRAVMASRRDAERATGYITGGISPLGQRRRLPALLDESALGFETICVSAGRRGLEIELVPADLVALTSARVAAIASRE